MTVTLRRLRPRGRTRVPKTTSETVGGSGPTRRRVREASIAAKAPGGLVTRPRFRLHAAANRRSGPEPRGRTARGLAHRVGHRPWGDVSRHGLSLPRRQQRALRGTVPRGWPPGAGPARHEAAHVAAEGRGRRGPAPRRATGASAHVEHRLLSDSRADGRAVGSRDAPERPVVARARAGRRPHPLHRLLVPRFTGRVREDRGRLRLGLLPDPIQFRGRRVPGGDGRPAARRQSRDRRVRHGAAARRFACGQGSRGGERHLGAGRRRGVRRRTGRCVGCGTTPK